MSTTIEIERAVAAPASDVWANLATYADIAVWNPNIAKSYLIDGSAPAGEGALRQCDFADGKNWIRERIVEWREGESYTVDIYEGTMPLQRARATLGVRPQGDRASTAFMRFEYTPKFGVLGTLMNVLMMKRMMSSTMAKVLQGLGDKAEDRAA